MQEPEPSIPIDALNLHFKHNKAGKLVETLIFLPFVAICAILRQKIYIRI